MHHGHLAVIGAGHMGSSLIRGLIESGYPLQQLICADVNEEKLNHLKNTFSLSVTKDNHEAIEKADIVIFAVKPADFAQVLIDLKDQLGIIKPLIISIAAGIRTAHIEHWLGHEGSIIRAMPNMPALIGCGATALFANARIKENQRNTAEAILRALGAVVWLKEEALMDAVTALSGSGPAYFFLFMEKLQKGAEELGLPEEIARLLTLETALGAARLAMESGTSLKDLRQQVTSPGGTTEKALAVFEAAGMDKIIKEALTAAKNRSEELADILGR